MSKQMKHKRQHEFMNGLQQTL